LSIQLRIFLAYFGGLVFLFFTIQTTNKKQIKNFQVSVIWKTNYYCRQGLDR